MLAACRFARRAAAATQARRALQCQHAGGVVRVDGDEAERSWREAMRVELPEATQGRKHVLDGLYSLAVEPLQQAREILAHARQPAATAAVVQLLLHSYQKQGRFACVLSTLDAADVQDVALPGRQAIALNALLRLHRWRDALALIDRCLADADADADTALDGESALLLPHLPVGTRREQLVVRGHVLSRCGDAGQAHDCFERALGAGAGRIAAASELSALLGLRRFQHAEQLLAAAPTLAAAGGRATLQREHGVQLTEQGQYDAAERQFEAALSLFSDAEQVSWSLFELARMYHLRSRHIFAEGLYNRAFETLTELNLHTDAHHVVVAYAQLLRTLGQHSKADTMLNASLEQLKRLNSDI